MEKAIRIKLYGLDKDGNADRENIITEVIRTPSMQGLEEATKAGANVMYVGTLGNREPEPDGTITVTVGGDTIPHIVTCIAAFIIDSDPTFKHKEVTDWGIEIRGLKRRLIPGLMPDYFKAAYELVNSATADVPTSPKADGEGSLRGSSTPRDSQSGSGRSASGSTMSTGSPRAKRTGGFWNFGSWIGTRTKRNRS